MLAIRKEWKPEVEPVLRRERELGEQQKFFRPLPDKLQTLNRRERELADQFTFNMLSSQMLGLQVSNGKERELGIVLMRVQGWPGFWGKCCGITGGNPRPWQNSVWAAAGVVSGTAQSSGTQLCLYPAKPGKLVGKYIFPQ